MHCCQHHARQARKVSWQNKHNASSWLNCILDTVQRARTGTTFCILHVGIAHMCSSLARHPLSCTCLRLPGLGSQLSSWGPHAHALPVHHPQSPHARLFTNDGALSFCCTFRAGTLMLIAATATAHALHVLSRPPAASMPPLFTRFQHACHLRICSVSVIHQLLCG